MTNYTVRIKTEKRFDSKTAIDALSIMITEMKSGFSTTIAPLNVPYESERLISKYNNIVDQVQSKLSERFSMRDSEWLESLLAAMRDEFDKKGKIKASLTPDLSDMLHRLVDRTMELYDVADDQLDENKLAIEEEKEKVKAALAEVFPDKFEHIKINIEEKKKQPKATTPRSPREVNEQLVIDTVRAQIKEKKTTLKYFRAILHEDHSQPLKKKAKVERAYADLGKQRETLKKNKKKDRKK